MSIAVAMGLPRKDVEDIRAAGFLHDKGRPPWQAIEEIRKGAGTQFDPAVVEAFERVSGEFISLER